MPNTKPTYEELRQALQAIVVDTYETYITLQTGRPIISIGQWMRITNAQALIGRIAEAESN
jgi:hypothetical protein